MLPLTFALLVAVQTGPIKDWEFQWTERNRDSGQEEITALLKGKEMTPLVMDFKDPKNIKLVLDVREISGKFYTTPKSEREKSEEVEFSAGRGHVNKEKGLLELSQGVHLKGQDGAVLDAPAALVRFTPKFVCLPCGTLQEDAGTCQRCGKGLKGKDFRLVEVPGAFTLHKPSPLMRLSGEGLMGDGALRELTVARKGTLETEGRPARLSSREKAAPSATPEKLRVSCDGRLTMLEAPNDPLHALLRAQDHVRLDRIDALGKRTVVTCDEAELRVSRSGDPKAPPEPEFARARGNIQVKGDDGLRAEGETLEWRYLPYSDGALDEAVLTGKPWVTAELGARTLRARTATLERLNGKHTFEGEVSARMTAGTAPDAKPMSLRSDRLVLLTRRTPQGKTDVASLEALGSVLLEGLMPGQGGGEGGVARADRFFWDPGTNRGILEGSPAVRVRQGENLIRAPMIVLEGESIVVLKGPKEVRIVQPREDGTRAEFRVSCEGDLELDSSGGATVIRMNGRSEVRTGEFHLTARRMTARMSPGKKELGALSAAGDVRAVRLADAVTMYGERLEYEPQTQGFLLIGNPLAVAEAGRQRATQERIRVYEKEDPATKKKVRYTELRGGKHGVHLVIEEKPK